MDLKKESVGKRIRIGAQRHLRYFFLIGLIVVVSVFFGIANKKFFSLVNIGILLRSISVLYLLSMGMTFIMITGGIDLSVGSNVAFSGGVGVIVLLASGNPILGFMCSILAGASIGFINGFFVGKLKLSAFMITLATMALGRGLALVLYKANALAVDNEVFLWLGKTSIGPFPIVIFFVVIAFLALQLLLSRHTFGKDVYAVGSNIQTAYLLGRRVNLVIIKVYVLTGILAGISAIITVGRVSSGQPWAGLNLEFDAITAVIMGGTSLSGGEGNLVGTIIGVIFYGIVINGLILTGVNPYFQSISKGLILLTVVLLDSLGKRNGG